MIKSIEGLTSEEAFLKALDERISMCTNEIVIAKLDIDNFETVNRFYGEFVGDQVIKKVAHVLVNNLDKENLVCRTYKDELTVLMDATPPETGALIIEEIRTYFDEHLILVGEPEKEIAVRFSAGLAAFPRNGRSVTTLMDAADDAMRKAKSQGKNQIWIAQREEWIEKRIMIRRGTADKLSELSRRLDKTEAGIIRSALEIFFQQHDPTE